MINLKKTLLRGFCLFMFAARDWRRPLPSLKSCQAANLWKDHVYHQSPYVANLECHLCDQISTPMFMSSLMDTPIQKKSWPIPLSAQRPIWADAIPAPPVVDVLVRPFFRGTSCLQQKNRTYDYEANLNGLFWNSLASSSSRAFLTLGSWRSAHTRHQNFVFINSPVPFHWNYNYYHGFWNRPEIKVEIYNI